MKFARLTDEKLGIYPVVPSVEWLKKLLPLRPKIIQIRIKNLDGEALESAIIESIEACKAYPETQLFINDFWELAIKHKAYGVHLGQEDIQDADTDAIAETGVRLGISTHGFEELDFALAYEPSYCAVGAIFPTKTKDMTGQIQGVDKLAELRQVQTDIPIVAIGGIYAHNIQSVVDTGVNSVAVVTALTESDDYQRDFKKLQSYFCW